MGLQETGLKFVAENGAGFVDSINQAKDAERGFASESTKAAQSSEQAHGSILDGLKNIASFAAGAAAAGIAALTAVVVSSLSALGDWSGKIKDLSDQLGTSIETTTGLALAIERVGGNAESISTQLVFLTRGLEGAKGALGPTGIELKKLGVQFKDAKGNMLPVEKLLPKVAEAINKLPPGLEKTETMTRVFGRSGKDLNDVLEVLAGSGLEDATQAAKDYGLVLTPEQLGQQEDMARLGKDLEFALRGIAVTIGSQLLPIIAPLVQLFSDWSREVMPGIIAGITTFGATLDPIRNFLGDLFNNLTGASDGFSQFGDAINQTWAVIQQVVAWVTTNWPLIQKTITDTVNQIIADLTPAWNTIQGIVSTAVATIQSIVNTIFGAISGFMAENGDEILGFVQDAWKKISNIITTLVQLISDIVTPIWTALAKFISDNQQTIQDVITVVWKAIETVINTALTIIQGVINVAMDLIHGNWQKAWDDIKAMAESIWNGIKDFFAGIPNSLLQIGKNIIQGIIDGIKTGADAVKNALNDIIQGAINAIKRFLGIASPSKVMAGIGANMMAGLIQGWMGNGLVLPAPSVGGIGSGTVRGMASAVQMGSNAYSYANSRTYNLNVTSRESLASQRQEFALMEAMAG